MTFSLALSTMSQLPDLFHYVHQACSISETCYVFISSDSPPQLSAPKLRTNVAPLQSQFPQHPNEGTKSKIFIHLDPLFQIALLLPMESPSSSEPPVSRTHYELIFHSLRSHHQHVASYKHLPAPPLLPWSSVTSSCLRTWEVILGDFPFWLMEPFSFLSLSFNVHVLSQWLKPWDISKRTPLLSQVTTSCHLAQPFQV